MKNGSKMSFNAQELRKAISLNAQNMGVSRQEMMENISEQIGVSYSALKHWLNGHNAPSDLEKVKDIAEALNMKADRLLIEKKERKEDNMTTNQNIVNHSTITVAPVFSTEKDAIRSIYVRMVDYIESFRMELNESSDKMQNFKEVFQHLMRIRLDVSKEIFDSLRSFAVNYLQQMALIDRVFSLVLSEDVGAPDFSMLHDDFFKTEDLQWLYCNPCHEVELTPVCNFDCGSEDTALAIKAIKADWAAIEDGDPFVLFFYFENLIETAHARLCGILTC